VTNFPLFPFLKPFLGSLSEGNTHQYPSKNFKEVSAMKKKGSPKSKKKKVSLKRLFSSENPSFGKLTEEEQEEIVRNHMTPLTKKNFLCMLETTAMVGTLIYYGRTKAGTEFIIVNIANRTYLGFYNSGDKQP